MNVPDAVEQRLVDLASRLVAQTQAGRISWRRTGIGSRFIYTGRTGSVTVDGGDLAPIGIMWRGPVTMRVLDRNGNEVESLSASPVTATGAGPVQVPVPRDAASDSTSLPLP